MEGERDTVTDGADRQRVGEAVTLTAAAAGRSFVLFDLQLERLRLRALAARYRRDGSTEELRLVAARSIKIEQELHAASSGSNAAIARDLELGQRLRLSPVEMDLMWWLARRSIRLLASTCATLPAAKVVTECRWLSTASSRGSRISAFAPYH